MNNKEVIASAWDALADERPASVHEASGLCTDYVLKTSVAKRTMDNITAVFVAFDHFNSALFGRESEVESKRQYSQEGNIKWFKL